MELMTATKVECFVHLAWGGVPLGSHALHATGAQTIALLTGGLVKLVDSSTQQVTYLPAPDTAGGATCISVHPLRTHLAVGEFAMSRDVGTRCRAAIAVYTLPSLDLFTRIQCGADSASLSALAFSDERCIRDGVLSNRSLIVSAESEVPHALCVWDWTTGTMLLRAQGRDVSAVAFSPHVGSMLVTWGLGHVEFWRMDQTFTGLKLDGELGRFGNLDTCDEFSGCEIVCEDAKSSACSETADASIFVVSGASTGYIHVWDKGLLRAQIGVEGEAPAHQGGVLCVAAVDITAHTASTSTETMAVCPISTPSDIIIATAGADGLVKWWGARDLCSAIRLRDSTSTDGPAGDEASTVSLAPMGCWAYIAPANANTCRVIPVVAVVSMPNMEDVFTGPRPKVGQYPQRWTWAVLGGDGAVTILTTQLSHPAISPHCEPGSPTKVQSGRVVEVVGVQLVCPPHHRPAIVFEAASLQQSEGLRTHPTVSRTPSTMTTPDLSAMLSVELNEGSDSTIQSRRAFANFGATVSTMLPLTGGSNPPVLHRETASLFLPAAGNLTAAFDNTPGDTSSRHEFQPALVVVTDDTGRVHVSSYNSSVTGTPSVASPIAHATCRPFGCCAVAVSAHRDLVHDSCVRLAIAYDDASVFFLRVQCTSDNVTIIPLGAARLDLPTLNDSRRDSDATGNFAFSTGPVVRLVWRPDGRALAAVRSAGSIDIVQLPSLQLHEITDPSAERAVWLSHRLHASSNFVNVTCQSLRVVALRLLDRSQDRTHNGSCEDVEAVSMQGRTAVLRSATSESDCYAPPAHGSVKLSSDACSQSSESEAIVGRVTCLTDARALSEFPTSLTPTGWSILLAASWADTSEYALSNGHYERLRCNQQKHGLLLVTIMTQGNHTTGGTSAFYAETTPASEPEESPRSSEPQRLQGHTTAGVINPETRHESHKTNPVSEVLQAQIAWTQPLGEAAVTAIYVTSSNEAALHQWVICTGRADGSVALLRARWGVNISDKRQALELECFANISSLFHGPICRLGGTLMSASYVQYILGHCSASVCDDVNVPTFPLVASCIDGAWVQLTVSEKRASRSSEDGVSRQENVLTCSAEVRMSPHADLAIVAAPEFSACLHTQSSSESISRDIATPDALHMSLEDELMQSCNERPPEAAPAIQSEKDRVALLRRAAELRQQILTLSPRALVGSNGLRRSFDYDLAHELHLRASEAIRSQQSAADSAITAARTRIQDVLRIATRGIDPIATRKQSTTSFLASITRVAALHNVTFRGTSLGVIDEMAVPVHRNAGQNSEPMEHMPSLPGCTGEKGGNDDERPARGDSLLKVARTAVAACIVGDCCRREDVSLHAPDGVSNHVDDTAVKCAGNGGTANEIPAPTTEAATFYKRGGAMGSYFERRYLREQRRARMAELQARQTAASADDPQDVHAIAIARRTFGDYPLKLAVNSSSVDTNTSLATNRMLSTAHDLGEIEDPDYSGNAGASHDHARINPCQDPVDSSSRLRIASKWAEVVRLQTTDACARMSFNAKLQELLHQRRCIVRALQDSKSLVSTLLHNTRCAIEALESPQEVDCSDCGKDFISYVDGILRNQRTDSSDIDLLGLAIKYSQHPTTGDHYMACDTSEMFSPLSPELQPDTIVQLVSRLPPHLLSSGEQSRAQCMVAVTRSKIAVAHARAERIVRAFNEHVQSMFTARRALCWSAACSTLRIRVLKAEIRALDAVRAQEDALLARLGRLRIERASAVAACTRLSDALSGTRARIDELSVVERSYAAEVSLLLGVGNPTVHQFAAKLVRLFQRPMKRRPAGTSRRTDPRRPDMSATAARRPYSAATSAGGSSQSDDESCDSDVDFVEDDDEDDDGLEAWGAWADGDGVSPPPPPGADTADQGLVARIQALRRLRQSAVDELMTLRRDADEQREGVERATEVARSLTVAVNSLRAESQAFQSAQAASLAELPTYIIVRPSQVTDMLENVSPAADQCAALKDNVSLPVNMCGTIVFSRAKLRALQARESALQADCTAADTVLLKLRKDEESLAREVAYSKKCIAEETSAVHSLMQLKFGRTVDFGVLDATLTAPVASMAVTTGARLESSPRVIERKNEGTTQIATPSSELNDAPLKIRNDQHMTDEAMHQKLARLTAMQTILIHDIAALEATQSALRARKEGKYQQAENLKNLGDALGHTAIAQTVAATYVGTVAVSKALSAATVASSSRSESSASLLDRPHPSSFDGVSHKVEETTTARTRLVTLTTSDADMVSQSPHDQCDDDACLAPVRLNSKPRGSSIDAEIESLLHQLDEKEEQCALLRQAIHALPVGP